jgi:hypothetical protein
MFIQQPTRALERKIAGGESSNRNGLLDHSLRRWRYAKFESLGLVLSFRRCRFFSRCRHDQSLSIPCTAFLRAAQDRFGLRETGKLAVLVLFDRRNNLILEETASLSARMRQRLP